MKFFTLLLCAAFCASSLALVNAKHNGENQSNIKPTAAPLMSSTAAPTKAPKMNVAPTKSTAVTGTTKKPNTSAPLSEKQMKLIALPLVMPATVETPQKSTELKPLAVTGFITRNGSIYEITDRNGFGQIQARQANTDTNGEHVCNYGAVIIYSDVPCDKVTNVKVKEYESKPMVEETTNSPAAQETKPTEDNNNKKTKDKEDLTDIKKPVRRRPNKKRPNKNKNSQKQKPQQQKPKKPKKPKKRPNQNNQIRNGNNNKNNNRRRLQQEQQQRQQQQKRRNQQKRRRQEAEQQNNRKWQTEDDIEYQEYDEPLNQNQRRRNPNKSQRRQQTQHYIPVYADFRN